MRLDESGAKESARDGFESRGIDCGYGHGPREVGIDAREPSGYLSSPIFARGA